MAEEEVAAVGKFLLLAGVAGGDAEASCLGVEEEGGKSYEE